MEKDYAQTFDRKEAARRLGLSVATIDRELSRKNITHIRSGRRVLFTQTYLDDYISCNEHRAKDTELEIETRAGR